MFFRSIAFFTVLAWCLLASLVVFALYEWQWVVALLLVPLFFLVRGARRGRGTLPPLGSHPLQKEDTLHE